MDIITKLFELQDKEYQSFHAKLVPNIAPESVIGVRIPLLRDLAKKLFKDPDRDAFMEQLPHKYYEENQLHIMMICMEKDFDECIRKLEIFLPYANNWAVTDQPSPKCFKRKHQELLPIIERWLSSEHIYTTRYALNIYMREFLGEDFAIEQLEKIVERNNREKDLCQESKVTEKSKVKKDSEEYYLHMMVAWYMATAMVSQYEAIVSVLQERKLDPWTHNKSIQKAIESYRITKEQKDYLRTLKVGR